MTSKGDVMASIQLLSEMEKKLDELIANASQLRECEEENGACADLEHKQELLLNALLQLNNSVDEHEKHQLWQKFPPVSDIRKKDRQA